MDSSALKNEFLVESFENLSTINEDLTQLEKDPKNNDLLNKLYRTVHTMKGSASFLGYKKLQDITHSAENLLDALREGEFLINPDIIDTLLNCFDICHLILKTLEHEDTEGDVDIEKNKEQLEKLLTAKGVLETEAQTQPASKDESEEDTMTISSSIDENSSDDELSSLISGHRTRGEGEPIEDFPDENPVKEMAPIKNEPEEDDGGLSAAALDSLKELVGEGKIDPSVMADLQNMAAENTGEDSASVEVTPASSTPEVKSEELASVKPVEECKPVEEVPSPSKVEAKTPESVKVDDQKKSIADSFVRVNVKVLDKIMNVVGELVLNRNQILQFSNLREDHEFNKLAQQLNTITSELQSEVMSTRMQPIGSILTKFERLVRDFSRQNKKRITLKLSGQDTELDKTLIEAIKDPLVHIIRNACDHGMETIEEREKTQKSPEGTVHIKAYNESGQVTIEIVDDGRGLDREKIGKKAIEKEVITQEKYEKMSDTQVYNLIFAPGFSTAEKITNISGRGVGMDVVKTNIEKIGGSVVVTSELGVGTTFKLRIPLTLAIVPALIIKTDDESFAIPQLNLVELVRLETREEKMQIESIQGSEFLKLRGDLTPVFRLSDTLSLEDVHRKTIALQSVVEDIHNHEEKSEDLEHKEKDGAYNIVILSAENHFFGIIVDEILDTEEIVVKPLSSSLKHLTLFGGATIMGDGKVALILDALGFLNTIHDSWQSSATEDDSILGYNEQSISDGTETQENLLFRSFDGREYAVPLALVSRLEEFEVSKIEVTGQQPIVRYLNSPMPLIDIEKTLRLDGKSPLTNYKESGVEALSCIVTSVQGKNFGIVVKEVLDISIDKVLIDDTAVDREGILGTVFIQDRTISLIDLYAVIEAQNIGSFKKQKDDLKNQKLKGKSILVVDDSPMYRKMESDLLIEMGFDVKTANHGEDALRLMENQKFDLIVTDIEMPHLNGYEFAEKIRQGGGSQVDVPILALSTRCSEKDIERGLKSGFNFHMEKFKKFEVAEKVAEMLEEK